MRLICSIAFMAIPYAFCLPVSMAVSLMFLFIV